MPDVDCTGPSLVRWLLGTVLAVAIAAGGPSLAAAQVAAPLLNPTAMLVTTLNPAVQQWSTPSRVALGRYGSELTNFNAAGVATSTAEADGWYLQGRAVGESFSIGAEQLQLETRPSVGNPTDYRQGQAALAGQLGGIVALGAGVSQEQVTANPGPTATHRLPVLGVSARAWERVYLGLARGTETREFPTFNTSIERPVTRVGVGYHLREGAWGFHVEASRETRDAYDLEVAPGVFSTRDEQTHDLAVVEAVVANVLVGVGSYELRVENPSLGNQLDESRRITTLGWVPAQGFAIVLRKETRALENSTGTRQERTLDRIAVAWQF